jgi:hypothetical protein
MNKHVKYKLLVLSITTGTLLAACGGSGNDSNGGITPHPILPTDAVPASASATVTGMVVYLSALVAPGSETLEPVDTSTYMPPVDDAAEPNILN